MSSFSMPLSTFGKLNELPSFMHLFLYIEDEKVKEFYKIKVKEHNEKIVSQEFPDAGFDLYCTSNEKDIRFPSKEVTKIKTGVKCMARLCYKEGISINTGFYLYPRSSIMKTPLRLANSVGIIDSGYRGEILGAVDNISCDDFWCDRWGRFLQICSPSLQPIFVSIVDRMEDLSVSDRGEGGFGSTGN